MIEYVNFQNDVRFIADDEDGDCMDIDVKPGVEKVIFGDYYDFFLKLSKKVFPVKILFRCNFSDIWEHFV